MIELHLLGRFVVLRDGNPVSGDAAQKRRLALLPLLAGTDLVPVTRDRLIGILWPDHPDESARHLLSTGVHVLRRALGADAILSRGDELALNPERVTVDAIAFRRAATAGEHERALELYAGAYLDGFHVGGAAEFDQWVDGERAELARLHARALEGAAEQRALRGDRDGALAAWRTRAALDPYDARAALGLMRALAATGQRGAAIRHARVHAALLDSELGAAPDPEVTAYAELLRNAADAPEAPAVHAERQATSVIPASSLPAAESSATPLAPSPDPAAPDTSPPPAPRPRPAWKRFGPVTLALAVIAVILVWGRFQPAPRPELGGVRRIAVLPFRSDSAYWGEVLADELIYELRRIEDVTVPSRDVSFRYAARDPRLTARELRVDAVLSGHLHVAPDGFWIGIELVGPTGDPLFSERFHHASATEMQHDIATALATQLRRTIRPGSQPDREHAPSDAALAAYRRGRAAWYRRTPAALDSALTYFRAALAHDSSYALAFAGVADALNMLAGYDYGVLRPDSAYPAARDAAEHALLLDARLAQAHAALANVRANFDRDAVGAEREYLRALELDPQYASARQWLALLLVARGRGDEALAQAERATELEPQSPIATLNHAHVLYYRRDYRAARELVELTLATEPDFHRGHVLSALLDLAEGDAAAAAARLQLLVERSRDPVLLGLLACARAGTGDTGGARALLREMQALRAARHVPPELFALAHVALGENGRAVAALEEARRVRSGGLLFIDVEPLIDPLRNDPAFIAFRRQL